MHKDGIRPANGYDEMREVSPINAFAERFTKELDDYVRSALPVTMTNEEYGRATAAMLISLNRTLASCMVAFAKTHGVERKFVTKSQLKAFLDNVDTAYTAAEQGAGTVQ